LGPCRNILADTKTTAIQDRLRYLQQFQGPPNDATMVEAAAEIDRLRAENAAMQHDIARLMEAASHEATEGERLRAEVARLRHLLAEAGAERDAHWAEVARLQGESARRLAILNAAIWWSEDNGGHSAEWLDDAEAELNQAETPAAPGSDT
jgi:ATPase subunit of ABC transporter with duplicated ATPase domains